MFPKLFGDSGSEIFRKLQEYGGVNIGQSINTSKTFYVDQANGDDTNAGTSNSPFKSLTKAIQMLKPFTCALIIIVGDYDTSADADSYCNHQIVGNYLRIIPRGALKIPFYQYNNSNVLTFSFIPTFCVMQFYLDSSYNAKLEIGIEGYDSNANGSGGYLISNETNFNAIDVVIRNKKDNNTVLQIGEHAGFISNHRTIDLFLDYAYGGTNRENIVDGSLLYNDGISRIRLARDFPIKDSAGNAKTLKDVMTLMIKDSNGVPLNYQIYPTDTLN